MTTHAEGNFEIKKWDEKTWDGKDHKHVSGIKQTHAVVETTYHGDFEGKSEVHYLMTYHADTSADYVGLQTMVGKLGGKSGSFVLQGSGHFDPAAGTAIIDFKVVPGSGTGELSGLRGEGQSITRHGDLQPYSFDYDFE